MAHANVKLSKSELLLVCDEQFILTKNRIIDKVYNLFGDLSEQFTYQIKNTATFFPQEVLLYSPKIYKGEQYRSLPYVMLDYPRCFFKEDALAIRCLFWWGNFFSINLYIAGKYMKTYQAPVLEALQKNENTRWYIGVNEDRWQHHFEKDNYLSVNVDTLAINKRSNSFLKIAKKIPLQQWDEAYDFFISGYQEILGMLIK